MSGEIEIEYKKKKAKKEKASDAFKLFDGIERKLSWFADKELKSEINITEHINETFRDMKIGEKSQTIVYLYNPHEKYSAYVKELYVTHPNVEFELERADIAPKSVVEVKIICEPTFAEWLEFRDNYMFHFKGGWCPFDETNEALHKQFQESIEAQQRKKLPKNLRKRTKNAN